MTLTTLAAIAAGLCACTSDRVPLATTFTDIQAKIEAPAACVGPAAPVPPDAVRLAQQRAEHLELAIRGRLLRLDAEVGVVDAGAARIVLDVTMKMLEAVGGPQRTGPVWTNVRPADADHFTLRAVHQLDAALHQSGLAPVAVPALPTEADAEVRADADEFNRILVTYVASYIEGKYVDRFGNKLPAPVFSRTVGDTEIAGYLSVVIDAVGDFMLHTPVWVDPNSKLFYPAAFTSGDAPSTTRAQPSAVPTPAPVRAGAVKPAGAKAGAGASGQGSTAAPTATQVMVSDAAGAPPLFDQVALVSAGHCGIDLLKTQLIEYLSQRAAVKASSAAGLLLGTVGGGGVSFVAFEKFSIGDNKTLQTVVKTFVAKLAERLAMETAYRALLPVNDTDHLGSLPKLVEAVLTNQVKQ